MDNETSNLAKTHHLIRNKFKKNQDKNQNKIRSENIIKISGLCHNKEKQWNQNTECIMLHNIDSI